MNYQMYVIYDRVAGIHSEPFCAVNVGTAVRRFDYQMQNSQMVSSDCELYHVGTFDSEQGVINSFEKPVFVKKSEVLVG